MAVENNNERNIDPTSNDYDYLFKIVLVGNSGLVTCDVYFVFSWYFIEMCTKYDLKELENQIFWLD